MICTKVEFRHFFHTDRLEHKAKTVRGRKESMYKTFKAHITPGRSEIVHMRLTLIQRADTTMDFLVIVRNSFELDIKLGFCS